MSSKRGEGHLQAKEEFGLRKFLMGLTGVCIWGFALGASAPDAWGQEFVLASQGTAKARIVLPAKPHPLEQLAGQELRDYIEKISGAELPIVSEEDGAPPAPAIYVGETKAGAERAGELGALGQDGFVLDVTPERAFLLGLTPRAVLNAAYEILDRLGVRWYFPGPFGESVPSVPDLSLPRGKLRKLPRFSVRQLVPDPSLGAAREFPTAHARGREELTEWARRNRYAFNQSSPVFIFAQLVPPEHYFNEHPEYFALVQGKRVAAGQLCTTNEDVLELMAQRINEYFAANPDTDIFVLSPNPGTAWCEDPACQALDGQGTGVGATTPRTDRLITLANELARRTVAGSPTRRIAILLPGNCVVAPPRVAPVREVFPMLDHVPFCHAHRMDDPACRLNGVFDQGLAEWVAQYGTRLMVCDLYDPWSAPFPHYVAALSDITHLANQGIFMVYFRMGSASHGGFMAPYLVGRLMWDASLDPGEEIERYYSDLYGPTGQVIRAMDEQIASTLRVDIGHVMGIGQDYKDYFLPGELEDALAAVRDSAAQAQQEGSCLVAGRLQRVADQVEYTEKFMVLVQADIAAAHDQTGGGRDQVRAAGIDLHNYAKSLAADNPLWYASYELDVKRLWVPYAEGAPPTTPVTPLGTEDFSDPVIAFARMVEHYNVGIGRDENGHFLLGLGGTALWRVTSEAGFSKAEVTLKTYDTDAKVGYLEFGWSADEGSTWNTTRVDANGPKTTAVSLESASEAKSVLLRVQFPPGAEARARLYGLTFSPGG